MNRDEELIEKGFKKFEDKQPRFSLQLKIQAGPVGIVFPTRAKDFYFDLSRHGLIHIGRLWIDW